MESSMINFVEQYQIFKKHAKDSILGLADPLLSLG
jgi:hypothetical protein